MVKIRQCDSPAKSDDGKDCMGTSTEIGTCNDHSCPGNKNKKRHIFAIYQTKTP